MTKEFIELIKNNKVLLNLKNCNCCLGTLSRGKILKKKFSEIILSATRALDIRKKEFFPYRLIVRNFEQAIKENNITLIIHDLQMNFDLYNSGKKLKIPQYFLFANNQHRWQCNLFEKVILPYPEEMKPEFENIKKDKIHAGLIVKEPDKRKLKKLKTKYKIGEKPVIVVTVSAGKSEYSEKLFQYAFENFSEEYDLIFIYGIFYRGKEFSVKSTIFEENLIELFSLSEKVISFGAYNTISEALSLDKEILSFPKPNNTGEQEVVRFSRYFKNIKIIEKL